MKVYPNMNKATPLLDEIIKQELANIQKEHDVIITQQEWHIPYRSALKQCMLTTPYEPEKLSEKIRKFVGIVSDISHIAEVTIHRNGRLEIESYGVAFNPFAESIAEKYEERIGRDDSVVFEA